jgi:hypothetical protein
MDKNKRAVVGDRLAITIRLSPGERKMLDTICDDLGCTQARTFRTILAEAFERHQEDRNRTKLEEIDDKVSASKRDLEQLSARLESAIAIIRSFELATQKKLDDLAAPTNATAVRLLAVVRSASGRDKIEAEIQNILRES